MDRIFPGCQSREFLLVVPVRLAPEASGQIGRWPTLEDCPLVLSDANRRCWRVWHHDALAAGRCAGSVLALAGSDSNLTNVRWFVPCHMSRDWLVFPPDRHWQNQGSTAVGRNLSEPCTISRRDPLGRNIKPKPQRFGNWRMGLHLRFRSGRIRLPLFFL